MSGGGSIGARTLRVTVRALFLLACLMLSPQPSPAQDRTPTPSAQELWKQYPLDPTPTSGAERTSSSTPTDSAGRPQDRAPAGSERALPIVLLACGFVAFGAALGLMWVRRRGAAKRVAPAPPASRPGNGSPMRSASDATAATPETGSQPSQAAAARRPNGHAWGLGFGRRRAP